MTKLAPRVTNAKVLEEFQIDEWLRIITIDLQMLNNLSEKILPLHWLILNKLASYVSSIALSTR